jgi:hypothetical protein
MNLEVLGGVPALKRRSPADEFSFVNAPGIFIGMFQTCCGRITA